MRPTMAAALTAPPKELAASTRCDASASAGGSLRVAAGVQVGVVGLDRVRDFFISYTAVNQPWAEWIAVTLERAGYTTCCRPGTSRPGSDFVHRMQQATSTRRGRSRCCPRPTSAPGSGRPSGGPRSPGIPAASRVCWSRCGCSRANRPGCWPAGSTSTWSTSTRPPPGERLLAGCRRAASDQTAALFPGLSTADPGGVRSGGPAGQRARFPGSGPGGEQPATAQPALLRTRGAAPAVRLQAAALRCAQRPAGRRSRGGVAGRGGARAGRGRQDPVGAGVRAPLRQRLRPDVVGPAGQPSTAATALAGLASRLGVPAATDQQAVINALFDLLRRPRPVVADLRQRRATRQPCRGCFLPPGAGSVLVTSRWSAWRRHAQPLPVTCWAAANRSSCSSTAAGRPACRGQSEQLDQLAELVGDLPLALDEAGAYLEQTRIGLGDYLEVLRSRARELFELDTIASAEVIGAAADQRRVATVWSVSLDRIRHETPAAEALLVLCAFLGSHHSPHPAQPATRRSCRPRSRRWCPTAGLQPHPGRRRPLLAGRPRRRTHRLHRLVQAVIRGPTGTRGGTTPRPTAVGCIWEAFPQDSWEPATWPVLRRGCCRTC